MSLIGKKVRTVKLQESLAMRLLSILVVGLIIIGLTVSTALSELKNQGVDNSFVSSTLKVERAVDTLQRDVLNSYNNDVRLQDNQLENLMTTFQSYKGKIEEDEDYKNNIKVIDNAETIRATLESVENNIELINEPKTRERAFKLLTVNTMVMTDLLEENKAVFVLRVRQTTKRVSKTINLVGMVSGGFILFLCGFIVYGIIRPLRKITGSIKGHAESYRTEEIDYKSQNELGILVGHYNQTAAQINSLLNINIKINELVDFHEVIEFVYNNFHRFIPYNRIGVSVITDHGSKVRAVELMTDGKIELGSNYIIDIDKTSLGELARTREVRILNDLETYYKHRPTSDSTSKILDEGIRSSLTVPLCVGEECIGFLFFSSVQKNVYNQSHVGFLKLVADHLAISIQKSFRHEDLILSTINGFATLVESRDADTGDHIDRMKSYCELVAKLAFEDGRFDGVINEKILFTISRYSALHDIGKIAIPDAILLKNGKLTTDEFEIIKTHPVIGAEILEEMGKSSKRIGNDIFREAIEIVKYHHEKYDGLGYPNGLIGKEIPIVARIVAIGDVLDALTSKRVYKDEFGFEESFAILLEGQGKHFDPELIDIVMKNREMFYELYETFQKND